MQLQLEIPAAWARSTAGTRRIAIVPGHAEGKPDVLVAWSPLIVLPDEQRAWVTSELRIDTPSTAQLQVTSDTTTTTRTGWPVRIVEATIHAKAGEPASEWRTAHFYAFFEHAAVAMIRGTDEARYRGQLDALRAILAGATPDWTGEVAALAELWDVTAEGGARPRVAANTAFAALHERVVASAVPDTVLRARLATLDAQVADQATAERHAQRGELLSRLGDHAGALAAYRSALALDDNHAVSRFGVATELAASGAVREAIAGWEAVAAANPKHVDALFNAGMAYYRLGEPAGALAAWEQALARSPNDFWIARKVVQALFALERYEAAAQARARLVAIWKASSDPAVRLQDEFVFDQFAVGNVTVHGFETLRPRDPSSYSIYTFRVIDRAHASETLEVAIETSDYAKARGVPYVISLLDGTKYTALGTSETLPPYPEMKQSVVKLVTDTLAARPKA